MTREPQDAATTAAAALVGGRGADAPAGGGRGADAIARTTEAALVTTDDDGAALAARGTTAVDDYERRYMPGQGLVLYRERSRAPWPIHAIFAGALATVVGAAAATGQLAGLLVGGPVLVLLWLLFSVLRVTVSEGQVHVQYGLFGPRIPIAAIESAEATRYDWRRFGGWGIRFAGGEWIYNMPGDGGHAVRVVWRTATGRRRVTLIGTRHAEAIAAQIQRARAAPRLPAGR